MYGSEIFKTVITYLCSVKSMYCTHFNDNSSMCFEAGEAHSLDREIKQNI